MDKNAKLAMRNSRFGILEHLEYFVNLFCRDGQCATLIR